MDRQSLERFANLDYDDFRKLALDPTLSPIEKIGFPNAYRQGYEGKIFADILRKLPALERRGSTVLDIGPGCSDLAVRLCDHAAELDQTLVLIDSAEMLALLPERANQRRYAGYFPRCPELLEAYAGRCDAVLAYSLLHYVFLEQSIFGFLDRALSLLAPGGALLLGDIPNVSKRKRFFASEAGVRSHREYTGTDELPRVTHGHLEPDKLDDAVVLALVARARAAGFDAFVLPQDPALPMSNRREDIAVTRP